MDKLEKHIKRKLQERELRPSDAAWGRIESQLGGTGNLERKRVHWYAIAASFIGVLLLSVAYFNSSLETQTTIEVVDTETEKMQETIDKEIPNLTTGIEITSTEAIENNEIIPIEKIKEPLRPNGLAQQVFVLNDTKKKEVLVQDEATINQQKLIDDKLNEVLNTVTSLEQQNIQVTDAEIDSLLLSAQRELLMDNLIQENGKVDAMALLNEAEDELDRTFRGQLFEKLKDGFFKVRTAVADRNN